MPRSLGLCKSLPPLSLTWGHSNPVQSHTIPDGDAGVQETVRWMKAMANGRGGAQNIMVRHAALQAVRDTERGKTEIEAVLDWVKRNIEFRGEYGETVQEPAWTLQLGAGDCDCQSTLAAAMLMSLGFETRFRTISLSDNPQELSHVYVEVRDKRSGQWIPLDPTVARSYPGWEPEEIARSIDYVPDSMPAASGVSLLGLAGLGLAAALLMRGR